MHQIDVVNQPSEALDGVTVPDAPSDVLGTGDAGSVEVSWSEPESDGGSPVTGYTVRAFTESVGGTIAGRCTAGATDDPDTEDPDADDPEGDDPGDDLGGDFAINGADDGDNGDGDDGGDELSGLTCTIDGLTDGVDYYLAVTASNAVGEGRAESERTLVTAGNEATPPSAPTEVKVHPGVAQLAITWSEPESDGGSPVTGYTARAFSSANGQTPVATCTTVAPAHACVLKKLTNGVTYHVGVTASNDVGEGPEPEQRTTGRPRTVPGAPRGITATSSGGRIKVSWSAPASTGGAPITGYRVGVYSTAKGGGSTAQCTADGDARNCKTSTLKVGRTHYVSVTARNAAGASTEPTRVKVTVRR